MGSRHWKRIPQWVLIIGKESRNEHQLQQQKPQRPSQILRPDPEARSRGQDSLVAADNNFNLFLLNSLQHTSTLLQL
jgi:hypothetical protein